MSTYFQRCAVRYFLRNTFLFSLYVVKNAEHETVVLQTQPANGCVTSPIFLAVHVGFALFSTDKHYHVNDYLHSFVRRLSGHSMKWDCCVGHRLDRWLRLKYTKGVVRLARGPLRSVLPGASVFWRHIWNLPAIIRKGTSRNSSNLFMAISFYDQN